LKDTYFRALLNERLKDEVLHGIFEYGERVLVACSGGKDSTALLSFLWRLMKGKRENLAAITIDEGIRGIWECEA
jgi:tRNA(Ile)-lysidine synthase TilS/MesJ